jgi:broad specificity phosphatase PhoE
MQEDELISFQEFVFDEVAPPTNTKNSQLDVKYTKNLFIIRDISSEIRRNIFDPPIFVSDKIPDETLRSLYNFIKGGENDVCVIYSPLRRAVETMKIIKKLFPKLRYKEHEYFREVIVYQKDHFIEEPITSENKEIFFERLKKSIDYLAKNLKEKKIVIISHESFIVQLTRVHLEPGQYIKIDLDVS